MRVLIVELDGRGHRLYYVRLLAEEALRSGASVRILVGSGEHVDEVVALHLGSLRDDVEVVAAAGRGWLDIEEAARSFDADVTVVPESDSYLLSVVRRGGWRGPGRLSLLVMRPRVPAVGNRVRRAVANTVKAMVLVLLTALPRVDVRVLRSVFSDERRPWPTVADPVGLSATPQDVEALRDRWGVGTERYWFGALGAITPNKNVPMLLDQIARTKFPGPVGVLVAGGIEPSVADAIEPTRAALDDAGVPLVVIDRLLEDVELDSAISAVDCLMLAYNHLGSSGTLGKAVTAGTRVLTAGSPTLRHDAAAVGAGASWCPLEPAAVSSALAEASRAPRPEPRDLADERTFAATLLGYSR